MTRINLKRSQRLAFEDLPIENPSRTDLEMLCPHLTASQIDEITNATVDDFVFAIPDPYGDGYMTLSWIKEEGLCISDGSEDQKEDYTNGYPGRISSRKSTYRPHKPFSSMGIPFIDEVLEFLLD